METVPVREISSARIADASARGLMLGVTNMGALAGVIVPLSNDIMRRTAHRDTASMWEAAQRAERDIEAGQPARTVSDLLRDRGQQGEKSGPPQVSIRHLSGARLEQAAQDNQTLIITSGRVAIALLVPVMPDWVEDVVEQKIAQFIDHGDTRPQPSGGSPAPAPGNAVEAAAPAAPGPGLVTPQREVIVRRAIKRENITGRRAIGIRVDADPADGSGWLLGVLTDTVATVIGEPIRREIANIEESVVYDEIIEVCCQLEERIQAPAYPIGVGVEIGGHVHNGQVVRSFNAHWEEFSLAGVLNAALKLPVVVENDANALAILERRFHGVKEDNMAVVLVTHRGIGAGLIFNGLLNRGSEGMAGELGHIPVGMSVTEHYRDERGQPMERCRCGNPDCLERVATPYAIGQCDETRDAGGYEAAKQQMHSSGRVRQNFKRAGRALGRGVVTLINLTNPGAVVFYGPPELFGPSREFHIGADVVRHAAESPYLEGLTEEIANHQFSTGVQHCRFIVRRAADDQRARAAAACLINRLMPTSQILETRPAPVWSMRPDASDPVQGGALSAATSAGLLDEEGMHGLIW